MGFGIDIAPIIHWVRSPTAQESIKSHTLDGVSKAIVFGRKCAEAVMGTLTSYLGSGTEVDQVAVERQSLSDRSGEHSEKCESHFRTAFSTINALNTSSDTNPAGSSDIERSTKEQQRACEIVEELTYKFLWETQRSAKIEEDNFISDLLNGEGKSEEEMQRELEKITDEYGLSAVLPKEYVSVTDSTVSEYLSIGDNSADTEISQKFKVMTEEARSSAQLQKAHPIPISATLAPQVTSSGNQDIPKEIAAPESPRKISEQLPIRSNFSHEPNNQGGRVITSRPAQKVTGTDLKIAGGDSSKGTVQLQKKTRVTKPLPVSSRLLEIPKHRRPEGQKLVHQLLKEGVEKAIKDLRKPANRVSQNALTGHIPIPPKHLKSLAKAKEKEAGEIPLAERCAKWPDNLRKTMAKEKSANNE